MNYIIYFAITIGILVFIHEFGHFAAAKLCGMRADVFAIGFGKRLLGWNRISGFSFGSLPKDFDGQGNTDYRLCLLPLGGYVKIAGMVDESFDTKFAEKEPQPYEFRSKPTYQKIIVITAGVLMNLLLAILIFWGNNFFQGKAITKTTSIGYVEPNSPADSIGFMSGDKILAINGKLVHNWEDVRSDIFINDFGENLNVKILRDGKTKLIHVLRSKIPSIESKSLFLLPSGIRPAIMEVLANSPAKKAGIKAGDIFISLNHIPLYSAKQTTVIIKSHIGQSLPLVVIRKKDTLNLAVTPASDGMIGVGISDAFTGSVVYKTFSFFKSFEVGWQDIKKITYLTFNMLGKVLTGKIAFGKAFAGPVKIAKFAVQSAHTGIISFLFFLAMLSLSLAIINILPFPALDGGHFVIISIEGIIRRELPIKFKIAIQNAGFVILLLLMVFIIYSD